MPVHGQMVIPIKARGGAPEYHRETRIYTPGSAGVPQLSDAAGRLAVEGYRAENAANAGTAQALARLGGALDNAVKIGAKAYQDYQAALAQNAYNQYEADEIRLKAELNTLQGQNALGEDGVMARLGRWREEAREKYAGNLAPIARDLFHRNIRRLDAATDAWAIGKQDRENINFQNSVSEGSMKNAETLALNNPGNDEIFHQTLGVLRAEIEKIGARNGWDMSLVKAKFQEAAQKLQFSRVKSLIDSEDYNGAERVLGASGGASGAFAQNEATARRGRLADTAGMDGAVVSLIREIAPKYGMDPELMLAISKAESGGKVKAKTSDAGAVGPMQLIPKWARKAGFDPYDLRQNIEGGISEFAQLLKKYGNEKEALIAYNWGLGNWDSYKKTGRGYHGQERPKESLQYVGAVYKYIGGRTAPTGQGQSQTRAQPQTQPHTGAVGAGQVPMANTGGIRLSPVQAMRFQNQIDAGMKKQQKEAQALFVAETSQRIAREAGQLPAEMREYSMQLEAQKIEDPQIRGAVIKYAKENMKQADDLEKARNAAQAYILIESGRKSGESVSEFIARVNRANISEEAKKLAIDGFEGKLEDNELTQTALNNLLIQIDVAQRKGEPMSQNAIYKFAKDNRLTLDQTKTALKYLETGGNLFGLKISDVQNAYIYLQGGLGKVVEKKDVPAWVFPAALEEVKRMDYAGKKLQDNKVLQEIISNLIVMGTIPGWLGTSSNVEKGKAMADGKLNEWKQGELPKVRGERDVY